MRVSDRPREQGPDAAESGPGPTRPPLTDPADAPVTGPPGGAGPPAGDAGPPGATADRSRSGASRAARGSQAPGEQEIRQRRRRRFFVAGIAAGAALIVIALCAGTVSVISTVDDFRDRADDRRETRELRDADCLSLEQRLNRLTPPGAAATPAARAAAIRDENAAVRIYVTALRNRRDQDGWRQLLDARTAYAEALDLQARSKRPAFYVPPRAPDGVAVSDQLIGWSPEPCAGPVRRLAVPDL